MMITSVTLPDLLLKSSKTFHYPQLFIVDTRLPTFNPNPEQFENFCLLKKSKDVWYEELVDELGVKPVSGTKGFAS